MLGAWPVLQISVLVMNKLSTAESAVFIYFVYFLLLNDPTIKNLFISTGAGVVPYCDNKRLSVDRQSAHYIFMSFGIIYFI